jgi:hypothetical protein
MQLEKLEEETVVWCRKILQNSPMAIRLLKSALNAVEDGHAGLQVSTTCPGLKIYKDAGSFFKFSLDYGSDILGACTTHCFQIIISSGLSLLMLILAFL